MSDCNSIVLYTYPQNKYMFPYEIWELIISYLSIDDLYELRQTTSLFRLIANERAYKLYILRTGGQPTNLFQIYKKPLYIPLQFWFSQQLPYAW